MLLVGSDDGVYRVSGVDESAPARARKTLDSGRVMRLRRFDGVDGTFAATETGLYRSVDGDRWTAMGVPREAVYAVGASRSGDRLYAGTRPAHVYVADGVGDGTTVEPEWRDLDGFQALPSRDEWRLPRHDDLAQVRDVACDPASPERVVAAVEVGGVYVSDDGGETWEERRDGLHDDVHDLHVVGPGEYVAATGFGLYHTSDAGRRWTRLDDGVAQRYFRCAFSVDGVVYASGALANSSTWDDDDAEPGLFACRDGGALEPVDLPAAAGTVTGLTAVDGDLVAATHRGRLFVGGPDGLEPAGEFPVPGRLTGRYTPVVAQK